MDTELKSKWVEALRSGKYRQTQAILRSDEEETPMFCCLGVLCVVAEKEPDTNVYNWLNSVTKDYSPFVTMNDDERKTFAQIADYIEANL